MTAITPDNGLRARLHRLARGSVVLAIALASCGISATGASAATDSDDEGAVELHVAAGVHGTVAPGSATTASLTVQNDSTTRLTSGRIVLEVSRTPLADDAAVDSWLSDETAAGSFDEIGADTTSPVDPEGSVTSSLFVPPEALADLAPGVYPLRASLSGAQSDGADAVTSTSVLIVTDVAASPVAVLVPITATPAGGALLTADELTTLTGDDGDLAAVLEGVSGTAAILAIDPSIPAAIRALGSSAPESARDWLQQLEELPNERFALQFGDADAQAQAQAGMPGLLQPTTLSPFVNPSNFTAAPPASGSPEPTSTPSETPSPSPSPSDGPVLPTDEQLTAIEKAVPGILWPRSDVSTENLATFSTYVDGEPTTVLSSTSVATDVGARATVEGHNVLVADAAASEALSDAASEADQAARQRSLAEANAHLYLAGHSNGFAPLLVALDRDETRSDEGLAESITAVDSAGFGLGALEATPATPTTLASTADEARAASLRAMLDSEGPLAQFATILDDPQLLLSPQRIRILRATGVGLSDNAFTKAVAAVHDATEDTLNAIDIPPASTIQLLSANADLPFSVRNDLPWPVNIVLSVYPSDARLDVEPVTPWVVQAGTTARVKVPVSARVGSGEVSLRLELSSPTGVPISQPETVRVAVRAEWETIGLAVFGGLIVLLIGLGIIRTVTRKRREAAATSEPESETARESDGPHDAEAAATTPREESNE
ncbi:DUF6049 family protein [uncultured Microbacterium sp.]|uniref:DUF6049 family protein n=1 Tax=uncultured Microbacterium sp. TaxID=191216 RepID=UPI0028D80764|nr:DUF6049 family protein [uncultured Microbacterium sp.]